MPLAETHSHAPLRSGGDAVWPIRQSLSALIILALLLGTFLAARRLSGAISAPLPPWQLAAATVLLLCWAVATRSVLARRWTAWLIGGVLLLFAIALSFPGERAVDWLVWLTVASLFVACQNKVDVLQPRRASSSIPTSASDHVIQQLTRSRSADGHEVIHGTLLAEFAPGGRSVTLYAAFCPPFERLPHVELESSANARLVETFHNGIQIEVRLPHTAKTPATATIEFYATDAK